MINVGKIEFEQTSIQIEITKEIIVKLLQQKSHITKKNNITIELFMDKLQLKEIEKIIAGSPLLMHNCA